MKPSEHELITSIMIAHKKMSAYEGAAAIAMRNADIVAGRLLENDPSGYLSEILRAGRQASVMAECAREAHDALAAASELALSARSK